MFQTERLAFLAQRVNTYQGVYPYGVLICYGRYGFAQRYCGARVLRPRLGEPVPAIYDGSICSVGGGGGPT